MALLAELESEARGGRLYAESLANVLASSSIAALHDRRALGVWPIGRLAEAEREFDAALRQSGGTFDDAAYNLKLCRALLAGQEKRQLASLKITAFKRTEGKINHRGHRGISNLKFRISNPMI
jgi:hypothetical protein